MGLLVSVLPDEPAIDREFTYSVPEKWVGEMRIGSRVRIPLHGRRVGGWVTAVGVTAPGSIDVRALTGVSGFGPPSSLLDLAGWAAWRWAGRKAHFMRAADPPRVVRAISQPHPPGQVAVLAEPAAREALSAGRAVVRLPPAEDIVPWAMAVAHHGLGQGGALVIVPGAARAAWLCRQLAARGLPAISHPEGWAAAAGGEVVVVGTRAAAFAPLSRVGAALVVDSHDESLREERSPTWEAAIVVAERCRRDSAPCIRTSACPTLEDLHWGHLVELPRDRERRGWPAVEVIDRREADPSHGLLTPRVVQAVRSGRRVALLVNRRGRAGLLVCTACQAVATCEACGAAVTQGSDPVLTCIRCATSRPPICAECGASRLKSLRPGTTRLAEHVAAIAGIPVPELSGGAGPEDAEAARATVVVGTEAVLHRAGRRDMVVFLDFDQELLAPRMRAAEQALALLVRAGRIVRGRDGRLLLQTRQPSHPVVKAATLANPALVSRTEGELREELGLPPYSAMAEVSGEASTDFVEGLSSGVEVAPLADRYLVRAKETSELCDALAAAPRPPGRLRVEVDPRRI